MAGAFENQVTGLFRDYVRAPYRQYMRNPFRNYVHKPAVAGKNFLKSPLGTAVGTGGLTAAMLGMDLWDATRYARSVKPSFNQIRTYMNTGGQFGKLASNTSIGSKPMKTLFDVLVDKMRPTKTASTQSRDMRTLNAVADIYLEKTAGPAAAVTQLSATAAGKAGQGLVDAGRAGAGWLGEMGRAAVGQLPAIGLGALGIGAVGAGYETVRDYHKRNVAYKEMFNEFPVLNEVPREQVDKYWSVLTDFAPKLATNPLVAGQFIENMINYGMRGVDPTMAGQLIQTQSQAERGSSGFLDRTMDVVTKPMLTEGMKAMTGAGSDMDKLVAAAGEANAGGLGL